MQLCKLVVHISIHCSLFLASDALAITFCVHLLRSISDSRSRFLFVEKVPTCVVALGRRNFY